MVDGRDAQRVDIAFTLVNDARGVLVVRNRDSWSLPGGRREPGETLAEAAARETEEESGLRVTVGGIVSVSERIAGGVHEVFVVFRSVVDGSAEICVSGSDTDVSEAAWVEPGKADELMPWYPQGVSALLTSGEADYFLS